MTPQTRNASRLLLVMLLASCRGEPSAPLTALPRQLSVAENMLVEADNKFAFKLFRDISARQPGVNTFISPLSVAFALGMTYNGAATSTQAAMQQTLELDGLSLDQINQSYRSLIDLLSNLDPKVRLEIANSIWYREGFSVEPPFLDANRTYFDAQVTALDFGGSSALGTINKWVSDRTSGKIPSIIDQINPLDVMFLINAIYFKGAWTREFNPRDTRDAPFHLPGGSTKNVPTMQRSGSFAHFAEGGAGLRAIDLGYSRGAYTMTIVLPGTGETVDALAARLDPTLWNRITGGFQDMSADLYLPRFKLEWGMKLNEPLSALGMEIAFDDNRADFTRISRAGGLYVSEVRHKTFVEVNEEGTEAAAATSVGISVTSAPPSVRIDRPFIFAMRERFSGTILFMGRISDPTVTEVGF